MKTPLHRLLMTVTGMFILVTTISAQTALLSNRTFDLGTFLMAEPYECWNPEMEIVGSTVHVIFYAKLDDNTTGRLYYVRSRDLGTTFDQPVKIFEITGNINTHAGMMASYVKRLAVVGNTVHVAFKASETVYYVRSSDNGSTFSDPVVLINSEENHSSELHETIIAASDKVITIGLRVEYGESFMGNHWYDELVTLQSKDNGNTFSTVLLSKSAIWGYAYIIDIVASGNSSYVLTEFTQEGTIRALAKSTDQGSTYSFSNVGDTLPRQINSTTSYCYLPLLSVSGNHVYTVWSEKDTNDLNHVVFARSDNGGNSFESPVYMSNDLSSENGDLYLGYETLGAKGSHVYIAFSREGSDRYVSLLRSDNYGISFYEEQDLSQPYLYQLRTRDVTAYSFIFDPRDNSGDKLYLGKNWPSIAYTADGGSSFTGWRWLDQRFTGFYRDRPKYQMDSEGDLHCLYENVYRIDGEYTSRTIHYRKIPKEPDPSVTNMALALTQTDDSERYDLVMVPHTPSLLFPNTFSAELWVKPDINSTERCVYLIKPGKTGSTDSPRGGFMIGSWEGGDGRQATAGVTTPSGNVWAISKDTIQVGKWNHIAMTYDGSLAVDNLKIYLNGKLEDTQTAVGGMTLPNGPLLIGGNVYYLFNGLMDEVRIWNHTLTSVEISSRFKTQLSGNESGLAAYYNFNNTFKDISANGNDGTPLYMETFVSDTYSSINQDFITDKITLRQIYPNPVNTSATISFDLPEFSPVMMKIVDLSGQTVDILINQNLPAGLHKRTFNAQDIPSGVYFLQLISDKTQTTRKLIILH